MDSCETLFRFFGDRRVRQHSAVRRLRFPFIFSNILCTDTFLLFCSAYSNEMVEIEIERGVEFIQIINEIIVVESHVSEILPDDMAIPFLDAHVVIFLVWLRASQCNIVLVKPMLR